MIMIVLVGILILTNGITLYLLLKKKKGKLRGDLKQIDLALKDFESRRGCMVEIRRVDPDSVFLWGSR